VHVIPGHRAVLERFAAPAVAIGIFDGVHRGHQELVRRARRTAAASAGTAIGLTFDPHPATVLAPAAVPPQIATLARRLELLAAAGLDACIVEPFTAELSRVSADDFVDAVLVRALGAAHVVIGKDWRYGHARAGTTDTLAAHGKRAGFTVDVVDPVVVDGEPASSTRVRSLLRAGELVAAARVLGRPHDVDGVVVRGASRGRAIGVPTANFDLDLPPIVPTGIYAVWLVDGATRRPAVASLGTNPTFVDGGAVTFEVHVLDWDGDLYGRRLRVELVERLREEAKFPTIDSLVAQIERDIAAARGVLSR
jgi:riboflavin kinase/FMN adenylyltransferase